MIFRVGCRLGIDVGKARIGVARSDANGVIVVPVATLLRDKSEFKEISKLVKEFDVTEIVVGLPLSLSGDERPSTKDARTFATRVAMEIDRPVRLVDERLTTVSAQRVLHDAGRDVRSSRPVIDQVAATIILQHALDLERSRGVPPGELVSRGEG